MSGNFPIEVAPFETMNFRSIQSTIVSESVSGKRLVRQIDNQRFGFTAKITLGVRTIEYSILMAFIMQQRSRKESFLLSPPELKDSGGVETGTLRSVGSHNQGNTTVSVDGFAENTHNRLVTGDFITFANHTKVYMVVAPVTSVDGASDIIIEPPLQKDVPNNTVITYNNVDFNVHLTNDIQQFGATTSNSGGQILYRYELDVEETLT